MILVVSRRNHIQPVIASSFSLSVAEPRNVMQYVLDCDRSFRPMWQFSLSERFSHLSCACCTCSCRIIILSAGHSTFCLFVCKWLGSLYSPCQNGKSSYSFLKFSWVFIYILYVIYVIYIIYISQSSGVA